MTYDEKTKKRLFSRREILSNGCWKWTGRCSRFGYGEVGYHCEKVLVHRLSLQLFKPNEFKSHLNVNHKCNYKKCFNPEHLYCGTYVDNYKDAVNAGVRLLKSFCKRGHEFTSQNTYLTKNNIRQCKECKKLSLEFSRWLR